MKTRIMVVDDDANMRDLMITLLESEGYDVIPAENAAAAQAAFEGPQPDAALLDLQLPDGHGRDLFSKQTGRSQKPDGAGQAGAGTEAIEGRGQFPPPGPLDHDRRRVADFP